MPHFPHLYSPRLMQSPLASSLVSQAPVVQSRAPAETPAVQQRRPDVQPWDRVWWLVAGQSGSVKSWISPLWTLWVLVWWRSAYAGRTHYQKKHEQVLVHPLHQMHVLESQHQMRALSPQSCQCWPRSAPQDTGTLQWDRGHSSARSGSLAVNIKHTKSLGYCLCGFMLKSWKQKGQSYLLNRQATSGQNELRIGFTFMTHS